MSTPDVTAAPRGWPVPGIRFADAVKRGFRQYVAFDGRASRSEFWYWYLFVVGVLLALIIPSGLIGGATSTTEDGIGGVFVVGFVLAGLFYAVMLLPTLAVACRRLHDAGFSGLFLLLGLITGLIPLIMCMLPTSPAAARFGPPGQVPGQPGFGPGPSPAPAYGGQPSYGGPDPYAGQPPYGGQEPHGGQGPYGGPAPYGAQGHPGAGAPGGQPGYAGQGHGGPQRYAGDPGYFARDAHAQDRGEPGTQRPGDADRRDDRPAG